MGGCASAENAKQKAPRKIAVQTWTFHNHTLTDTVKMLKEQTDIRSLECYPRKSAASSVTLCLSTI